MPARIQHITYHLPEKNFSNEEFFTLFPEMRDNTNLHKVGIVNRRISAANETASDLAIKAAHKLFEETGIQASEIEFLLYVSVDLDVYTPATSSYIHRQLGLSEKCGALDHTHGCSAYIYGLTVAQSLLETLELKNVLLLTANTLTKKLHPKDKASRFLFGDGAAATLLTASKTKGLWKPVFGSDSKNLEKIIVPHGRERTPINENSFIEVSDEYGNTTTPAHFFMDGVGVFMFSIYRVPKLVKETLEKNGLTMQDIDLFIFHQASYLIIDTLCKKLGIPASKTFSNSAQIGNTVGASIPIALAGAMAAGVAQPGHKIMLVGFGVGLSLGATIVTL